MTRPRRPRPGAAFRIADLPHGAVASAKAAPKAPSKAARTRAANELRARLAAPSVVLSRGTYHWRVTINNVETVNELNRREKGRRELAAVRAAQVKRVSEGLFLARASGMPSELPSHAVFVRVAKGTLDELVNLPASLKAVEDAVCAFFGVDDGPSCPIVRRCDQRYSRVPGVEVVLHWAPATSRGAPDVEPDPRTLPRCNEEHPTLRRAFCCRAAGHKGPHADSEGEVLW